MIVTSSPNPSRVEEEVRREYVLEWLRDSDVYASLISCLADEEGERKKGEGFDLSLLPQCKLDCGDALLLYRVMGAWCLSWDRVPKAVFFPLWLELDPETRRNMLVKYKYYTEELHVDNWRKNMIQRDDVGLFALGICGVISIGTLRNAGAVRCIKYMRSRAHKNTNTGRSWVDEASQTIVRKISLNRLGDLCCRITVVLR